MTIPVYPLPQDNIDLCYPPQKPTITVHEAITGNPVTIERSAVQFLMSPMTRKVTLFMDYIGDSAEPNLLDVKESYEEMKTLLKMTPEKEVADAYVTGYEDGFKDLWDYVMEFIPLHLGEVYNSPPDNSKEKWLKDFLQGSLPVWTTLHPYPPKKE